MVTPLLGVAAAMVATGPDGWPQVNPATANAIRPSTLTAASVFCTKRPGPRPSACTALKTAITAMATSVCGETVSVSRPSGRATQTVWSPAMGTKRPR